MRRIAIITSLVIIGYSALGQYGTAFYHLRNATFQSTSYNAAMFPAGKFFVGLPAISGVAFYANSRFSYNDAFKKLEDGTNQLDVDNIVSELGIRNNTSAHSTISLLHLGVRLPSGAAFSLFANERLAGDILFPKDAVEWFWNGNGTFVGKKVNFGPISASVNYYREYGLGLAYKIPKSPYNLGIRVKYIQGLVNISTPSGFKASALTDNENYQLSVDWKKGEFRTSGVELLKSGNTDAMIKHLISNGNQGFAIDLGMEYRMNKYYTMTFAVNDIGFIGWKEDILNQRMADTSYTYVGLPIKGARNLFDAIDTLVNSFDFVENKNKYTSMLPANAIGSFIYSPIKGTDIISTINSRIIHGQVKMGLGVGIRQNFGPRIILSTSATRLPQQFVNIGAAFAVTGGPVQLYAAVDKIFGYSVPNMQWAEVRVGINLVFGTGNKTKKPGGGKNAYSNSDLGPQTKSKGVQTSSFHGQDVKIKGYDGIYTIVKTPAKNPAETITPDVQKNNYRPATIRSATGTGRNFDRAPAVIKSNSARSNKVGIRTKPASGTEKVTHEAKIKNQSAGQHVHDKKQRRVMSAGKATHDRKQRRVMSSGKVTHDSKKRRNNSVSGGKANHQKGKKKKPKRAKRKG